MGNHHAVTALHLSAKDSITGIFLRIEYHSRTFEVPEALIDTCSLHHTTVLSDIAEEYSKASILCVGMLEVTDTTIGTVGIESAPLF